jgi:hypothetical protein
MSRIQQALLALLSAVVVAATIVYGVLRLYTRS